MNGLERARCGQGGQSYQVDRIENPKRFNLADYDPGVTAGFEKEEAESIAVAHTQRMTDLQQRLYAEHNWALLIILQGVDAAGRTAP